MEVYATVDEVLDVAVDLIEITSHETELLQVMRPQEIKPLMERKIAISNFYGDMVRKLERRRTSWSDLDDETRDEIRETNEWINLIVGENARVLQACTSANEKLLTAIKDAAAEHYGGRIETYTGHGKMAGRPRLDSQVKVSIGVDEEG